MKKIGYIKNKSVFKKFYSYSDTFSEKDFKKKLPLIKINKLKIDHYGHNYNKICFTELNDDDSDRISFRFFMFVSDFKLLKNIKFNKNNEILIEDQIFTIYPINNDYSILKPFDIENKKEGVDYFTNDMQEDLAKIKEKSNWKKEKLNYQWFKLKVNTIEGKFEIKDGVFSKIDKYYHYKLINKTTFKKITSGKIRLIQKEINENSGISIYKFQKEKTGEIIEIRIWDYNLVEYKKNNLEIFELI